MNTSQCAVYQVKEAPEYRNVRFRSYAKLKSEGKEVRAENYQQVYIGRIQPGEIPADIKHACKNSDRRTLKVTPSDAVMSLSLRMMEKRPPTM